MFPLGELLLILITNRLLIHLNFTIKKDYKSCIPILVAHNILDNPIWNNNQKTKKFGNPID